VPSVSIRLGGHLDLLAACELWFRADAARRSTDVQSAGAADLAEEIGELYRRPPVHLLLACRSTGDLVGTVLAKPRRHEPQIGQISLLAVEPTWQDQGIGSSLLDAAVEWLRSDGCRSGQMYVRAADPAMCQFYERRGWSATGEIERQPATGEVELVFARAFEVER
jgi:ribosomal protein S18 acetylase RimI-like enzyme